MTHRARPTQLPARIINGGMACPGCHKKLYPNRRTARRALRALYPADVGQAMDIYRCRGGGTGFHFGHAKYKPPDPPRWPTWQDSCVDQPCQTCPAHINAGDPVAWLNGFALCFDCGDAAEHAALAAS